MRTGFLETAHLEENKMAKENYAIHPFADLFPPAIGDEYEQIKLDIDKRGMHFPIILYKEKILDGRTRQRICLELGFELEVKTFNGSEEEALAFAISANLHRRHLTIVQRAALAVHLLKKERDLAEKRMLAGKKIDPTQPNGEGRKGEAAELVGDNVGISRETVRKAERIAEQAPEVLEEMKKGNIRSIPEAEKCAHLPDDIRRDVLDLIESDGIGVNDAIRVIRRNSKMVPIGDTHNRVEIKETDLQLIYGVHVLDGLRDLEDNSVHVCCTSPPYFHQRDYSLGSTTEWADGWVGQLGLEENAKQYVGHLVGVFREVRRVLRDDGILWLNLGDKYDRGNLMLVPPRVAIALKDDGWILRRDIVWNRPNITPESTKTRPTGSHEYIYMFVKKSSKYFYDSALEREPMKEQIKAGLDESSFPDGAIIGRNLRSVWTINTQPTNHKHLAPWPEELVERMLLLSTSGYGVCPKCGAPWKRATDRPPRPTKEWKRGKNSRDGGLTDAQGLDSMDLSHGAHSSWLANNPHISIGWMPRCDCDGNDGSGKSLVLDPFSGSATTGLVALKLGHKYIGIDLDQSFLEEAKKRIHRGLNSKGQPKVN